MAREEYSENVQKLMNNPKNIRNIGILSHIHHGKCVSKDSRIALANGEFPEAQDIFNKYSNCGRIIKSDKNENIIDIGNKGLKILSLNKETLKIEEKEIQILWKLKADKELINVELDNGFRVSTTPEHKFLTFDGKIKEIEAGNLHSGMFIICGRNIDYKQMSLSEIKKNIIKRLSTDIGFYVRLKEDFASTIKEKIMDMGVKNVCESIDTHYHDKMFYSSCVYHGRYRLKDLNKLCKLFNLSFSDLYDSIDYLNYRKKLTKAGQVSTYMKLPKTAYEFTEFFYYVGLLFGDGCRTFLTNDDKYIQKRFMEISKQLGFKPSIYKPKDRTTNILSNGGLTLFNVLNKLFDYSYKQKSKNIYISKFLQTMPKYIIAEFIKGYFDADGTVEKGRSAVSISSASDKMIRDMHLLLLKFGCLSSLRGNTIYISGQSSNQFLHKIGFSIDYKKERLEKLVSKSNSSKINDIAPLSKEVLSSFNLGSGYRNYQTGEIRSSFFSLNKMLEEHDIEPIRKIVESDVSFVRIRNIERKKEDFVYDFTVSDNHNFIAEGMVIHNTCLTDNLAAAAGMMAQQLVGERMLTWIDDQERERLMTIYGATVTMAHQYENEPYLINLMDTPGHVDFGADVTQALRAVDGGVVMVCAVEGIMPQTETVLKQALAERVKPILFINKVDRAIKELKLTPEQLQKRLSDIVVNVNKFIQRNSEPQFKDKWVAKVEDGSVAFGSALRKWAISIPYMKKSGVTFKDIIDLCSKDKDEELAKRAPMHIVVMDMVIKHLPSPLEAQKYRIQRIWKGDIDSEVGKQLTSCDPNGKLAICITKIVYDAHAGMICTGRVFSGRLKKGQDVYMVNVGRNIKMQQVTTFIADKRISIEEVLAGNVVGMVGLTEATAGETLCDPSFIIDPFEAIKHVFEPVVTKSIEPKNPQDLPRLIDALKILGKEDPTLKIEINPETGETLVSGLGELHLDAKVERKIKEKGVEIVASPPIVVYRETVTKSSPEVEGKSPNKHNKFYLSVEPISSDIYKAMIEGTIRDGEIKGKNLEMVDKLGSLGMDRDKAKSIILISNHCILIDNAKGVQYLNETIELIKEAFKNVVNRGPLADEPCAALLVNLNDAALHEDAVHRGPAQIIPAVRSAIKEAMMKAGATLLEPKQILRVDSPQDYIGNVTAELSNRRGEVTNIEQEEFSAVITVKLPVAEMFGFEGALKSATAGKGFQSLMDVVFEKVPNDLKGRVVAQIRERKGLTKELPEAEA